MTMQEANFDKEQRTPENNCGTNSSFNFIVGAISVIVAGVTGYLIYSGVIDLF